VAVEKLTLSEVRRNFIARGCPVNDVFDFGEHFLSSAGTVFSKEGISQQPQAIALKILSISRMTIFRLQPSSF
jgi:hypothetical protein